MKSSHNSKIKLTLDKLRITKLENPDTIKGGAQNLDRLGQSRTDTFCTKDEH